MTLVTTTANFGAAPGSSEVVTDVAGFSGLTSANYAEAFTMAEASADHDVDDAQQDKVDHVCSVLDATHIRVYSKVRCGQRIGLVPIRVVSA